MRKILLIISLLSTICSSALAIGIKDTVGTDMDFGLGWDRSLNRAFQQSDGRYVIIYGKDSSGTNNANFVIATSTDGGETWSFTARLNDTAYNAAAWGMGWESDVCYPMNGTMGEQDQMIWKITNGAITSRDTIHTQTLSSLMASGGWAGDGDTIFAAWGRASNYALVYRSNGALPNTWTPADSLSAAITNLTWRWGPGPGKSAIGFTPQDRDMYVATQTVGGAGINAVLPANIVPAPVLNPRHYTWAAHKIDGEDSLYFWAGTITGRADSALWFYRMQYYRNGGIDSVRLLDSVLLSSETDRPTLTGTGDTCAARPFITSNASNLAQVIAGWCLYPDTDQRDSVNIVYQLSNDTGKTFGSAITIYDQSVKATANDDEQRVLNPTAPQQFYNNTLSVFFHNGAVSPAPLFIVTDVVAQPGAGGLPTAIYKQGVSGLIYKAGESGKKSKP